MCLAAAGDSARPAVLLPPLRPGDIAAFPKLNPSGIAGVSLRGVRRKPSPPPPPDNPAMALPLAAGESAEKCLGVLLADPGRLADRGRVLGVPAPVGVNPSERRMVPADGVGEDAAGGMASAGAAGSFGLDRTCHRSDDAPGRARRGAMLIEAYLG